MVEKDIGGRMEKVLMLEQSVSSQVKLSGKWGQIL